MMFVFHPEMLQSYSLGSILSMHDLQFHHHSVVRGLITLPVPSHALVLFSSFFLIRRMQSLFVLVDS